MVGGNPVHLKGLGTDSPKDVATADDNTEFDAKRVNLGNFIGDRPDHAWIDAEAHFAHHGFAGEFEKYPLVFWHVAHRASLTPPSNLGTLFANREAHKTTHENVLSEAVNGFA